ncbi:L-dopachrome tautomerase-related protein [Sphingomonas sp. Leaf10]|uniref:L-dopachrome tautomerase-related protein n=1 Tax=Sphingomonas sp. Leaf10 TaxID=1735676 RepID=UPI0006F46E8A|nr:L-dopachrome tautomerase-related protein [Sphingomonas sp. Leaf10]KQM33087.1 gluconolaconase [Sphingomonas sp. Leaf10]
MKSHATLLLATIAVAAVTPGAMARDAAPAPRIERVAAFDGAMPTGVTVAPNGRIFVNFPQWGDRAPFTVAELVDGKAVPYPDAVTNRPDPANPAGHFISVQSVVADGANRLWVLDTAAPKFAPPQAGGAKLVAIDLATNRVVKTIVLPPSVVLPTTYLNDVRFDLRQGEQGTAYITDSSNAGVGGIIVVDIATGRAIRRLSSHATINPEPGFTPVVDGEVLMNRPASGPATPVAIASDAIALSADGSMLYYGPLSGRILHAVPTALLRDPSVSEEVLARAVRSMGHKGASDGIAEDDRGRVFAGDYEHNAIRVLDRGQWSTLVSDPRINWPDTLSVGPDGYLYFTANQLHRQPGFHRGRDLRREPYELLRIRVGSGPVLLTRR